MRLYLSMSALVITDVGVILSPSWLELPNLPFAMVKQGVSLFHSHLSLASTANEISSSVSMILSICDLDYPVDQFSQAVLPLGGQQFPYAQCRETIHSQVGHLAPVATVDYVSH